MNLVALLPESHKGKQGVCQNWENMKSQKVYKILMKYSFRPIKSLSFPFLEKVIVQKVSTLPLFHILHLNSHAQKKEDAFYGTRRV